MVRSFNKWGARIFIVTAGIHLTVTGTLVILGDRPVTYIIGTLLGLWILPAVKIAEDGELP